MRFNVVFLKRVRYKYILKIVRFCFIINCINHTSQFLHSNLLNKIIYDIINELENGFSNIIKVLHIWITKPENCHWYKIINVLRLSYKLRRGGWYLEQLNIYAV